jgi:CubicO group peptidase (beta-lactamase class C family)
MTRLAADDAGSWNGVAMRWRRHLRVGVALATLAGLSDAQGLAAPNVDVESLRGRSDRSWTQAEREFVYAHWERAYSSRTVRHGRQVRSLPAGLPLPTFSAGGDGARELQRNFDDFQLAGIVVVHDGKVRLERYGASHNAGGRWASFSVAKSLTGTLIGAAIQDGFVSNVDDPVTRYIPELRETAYDGVTLRHLLTMTSGVRWNEDYADPASDVMLFYSAPVDPGADATVSYMKTLLRESTPGSRWHYNTGDSNLLGVVVARATGKDLAAYASEKIWAPYGMEQDASWMLDRSGHVHGGCCMQASTRDYARFGQFILDGARIDGRSVVADGWLDAATRNHADIGEAGFGYGYQWWTMDNGTFSAIGAHGQQVLIDPGRRLVVAINGASPTAVPTREAIAARRALHAAIRAALDSETRSPAAK